MSNTLETQAKPPVLSLPRLRSVSVRDNAISVPVVEVRQTMQLVGAWSRQADGTLVLRWSQVPRAQLTVSEQS